MSIGQNIKLLREKRGMSQPKLADLSGVPQTTISSLENNDKSVPSLITSYKLAQALNVSTDDFLADTSRKEAAK